MTDIRSFMRRNICFEKEYLRNLLLLNFHVVWYCYYSNWQHSMSSLKDKMCLKWQQLLLLDFFLWWHSLPMFKPLPSNIFKKIFFRRRRRRSTCRLMQWLRHNREKKKSRRFWKYLKIECNSRKICSCFFFSSLIKTKREHIQTSFGSYINVWSLNKLAREFLIRVLKTFCVLFETINYVCIDKDH